MTTRGRRHDDPHDPNIGWRALLVVRQHPVTLASLIIGFIAAAALVLVLDEQSKGRERDASAAEQRQRLVNAIKDIRVSRREAIRISCDSNQKQNEVLLAVIDLSIESARMEGTTPPVGPAEVKRIVRPITPKATKRVCDALLANVNRSPPPPPP